MARDRQSWKPIVHVTNLTILALQQAHGALDNVLENQNLPLSQPVLHRSFVPLQCGSIIDPSAAVESDDAPSLSACSRKGAHTPESSVSVRMTGSADYKKSLQRRR